MNTENLLLISKALLDEITKSKLEKVIKQLLEHLNSQIQEPNQPQHEKSVAADFLNCNFRGY